MPDPSSREMALSPAMNHKAVVIFVGLLIAQPAVAEDTQPFLSWYNGWGTHIIWGAGKVSGGSYDGTAVQCGDAQIKVKVIYDTHTAR
jgi:hypothetical protein